MSGITVNEKFYQVVHSTGFVEIVRRDVYWDSGFKDTKEIERCNEIEAELSDE